MEDGCISEDDGVLLSSSRKFEREDERVALTNCLFIKAHCEVEWEINFVFGIPLLMSDF